MRFAITRKHEQARQTLVGGRGVVRHEASLRDATGEKNSSKRKRGTRIYPRRERVQHTQRAFEVEKVFALGGSPGWKR